MSHASFRWNKIEKENEIAAIKINFPLNRFSSSPCLLFVQESWYCFQANWKLKRWFLISRLAFIFCLTFRNLLFDQTLGMCMLKQKCNAGKRQRGRERNREKKTLWGMQNRRREGKTDLNMLSWNCKKVLKAKSVWRELKASDVKTFIKKEALNSFQQQKLLFTKSFREPQAVDKESKHHFHQENKQNKGNERWRKKLLIKLK